MSFLTYLHVNLTYTYLFITILIINNLEVSKQLIQSKK